MGQMRTIDRINKARERTIKDIKNGVDIIYKFMKFVPCMIEYIIKYFLMISPISIILIVGLFSNSNVWYVLAIPISILACLYLSHFLEMFPDEKE